MVILKLYFKPIFYEKNVFWLWPGLLSLTIVWIDLKDHKNISNINASKNSPNEAEIMRIVKIVWEIKKKFLSRFVFIFARFQSVRFLQTITLNSFRLIWSKIMKKKLMFHYYKHWIRKKLYFSDRKLLNNY